MLRLGFAWAGDVDLLFERKIKMNGYSEQISAKTKILLQKTAEVELAENAKIKADHRLPLSSNEREDSKRPFANVVGHEKAKEEISAVLDWFNRSKELKAKGLSLPRGILLFGAPGNGKSLFIKEIIRACEAPVFVLRGDESNICKGIVDVFKKAKDAGHAVVVIDELDMLVDDDPRVARVLQESMDGVESGDDILILSASNNAFQLPDALKRPGRFDKLIAVTYPSQEEALEYLEKCFRDFGASLPEDFDEREMASFLLGLSFSGVKAVANDLFLRHGFSNITQEMIDDSVNRVDWRYTGSAEKRHLQIAVHEAGHAVMASAFPQYFALSKMKTDVSGGETHVPEVDEGFWPHKKSLAMISILMAGNLAERMLFHNGSRGCEEDLQEARRTAYNLINISGYSSCAETLPLVSDSSRRESQIKLRHNEKKVERLLRRCERKTRHYLKANRKKVEKLGSRLFEKGLLKRSEIEAILKS